MSLSRAAMLELMALVDGELQGEGKKRAEELALQSEEARRVVDALRATEVPTWLTAECGRRATAADGIANEVMARLAGGAARSDSRRQTAKTRFPLASRAATMSVISALALAAGVAMYFRAVDRKTSTARLGGGRPPAREMGTAGGIAPPHGDGNRRGVEVEEIDSSAHVSIFEISALANATAPSSVVVWIDDDPGEK